MRVISINPSRICFKNSKRDKSNESQFDDLLPQKTVRTTNIIHFQCLTKEKKKKKINK